MYTLMLCYTLPSSKICTHVPDPMLYIFLESVIFCYLLVWCFNDLLGRAEVLYIKQRKTSSEINDTVNKQQNK